MGLDIIVTRLIGFCLTSIGILAQLLWLIFKYPFEPNARIFVKTRNSPPPILHDKRWGEHKYIKLDSGIKLHYVENGKFEVFQKTQTSTYHIFSAKCHMIMIKVPLHRYGREVDNVT